MRNRGPTKLQGLHLAVSQRNHMWGGAFPKQEVIKKDLQTVRDDGQKVNQKAIFVFRRYDAFVWRFHDGQEV